MLVDASAVAGPAHAAPAAAPSWTAYALLGAALLAAVAVYEAGARRRPGGRRGRRWCAWGAVTALAVALSPPFEAGAQARFSVHMLQHLLLAVVVAPLVALAHPGAAAVRALRDRSVGRRTAGAPVARSLLRARRAAVVGTSVTARGIMAAAALALGFWVWHLPGVYAAALHDEALHAVQHAVMLASAVPFWSFVAGPGGRRVGLAVALLAAVCAFGAAGGALFALTDRPFYHPYVEAAGARPALADQRLGGALMAMGGLAYVAAGGALLSRAFATLERRARACEPDAAPSCSRPAVASGARAAAP